VRIINKVVANIFWLAFERVTSIFGTLIITIYTARYLGSEEMGLIHFSLVLIALIVPTSQLGSNAIIFNRVAKKYNSSLRLIKYSMPVRF
jgi:PST family polysaccharide transporter